MSIIVYLLPSLTQVTSSADSLMASIPDLDDFTRNLAADDVRLLVDLLKLAVAGRAGGDGREALSKVLTAFSRIHPQV